MSTTPRRDDRTRRGESGGDRLWLVAVGESVYASYPLPSSGSVELGRDIESDICIDAPSVSRRHARLTIRDGAIAIEDLGSANATRVRGIPVEPGSPTPIHSGELVELGSVSILLQRRVDDESHATRAWRHPLFIARLGEECQVAADSDGSFAVIVLSASPPGKRTELIRDRILAALGPEAVLGVDGDVFEIMTLTSSSVSGEDLAGQLRDELAAIGIDAGIGRARYPDNGETAESLLDAARQQLTDHGAGPIVRSRSMLQLYRLLERVAGGNLSVLLLGETGVGKEILAERVHTLSPRRAGRFVRLNCAALTETLLESELFGHEKGAFTGASAAKPGLLESGSGGTVFLDEVGEMSMSTQVKLLRVLEERAVRRVGGLESRPIDVRFVAATNRDLEAEIRDGNFRKDLFYRLAGISLRIPPLRERTEEILPLAHRFLSDVRSGGELVFSASARQMLMTYSWPGNIRELRNVIERAALLCAGDTIEVEHLPETIAENRPPIDEPSGGPAPEPARPDTATDADVGANLADLYSDDAEKERIVAALESTGGNQTQAAKILGISRRTLVNKLNKYKLPRPRKKKKG